MQNKMLGVRPYPLPFENFSSYILRLCYLNGIERISELLIAAGVKKPKTTGYSDWSDKHHSNAMDGLGVVLNRDKRQILECHSPQSNTAIWAEHKTIKHGASDAPIHSQFRKIQNLNTPFIRICPTCIVNRKVINSLWQCVTVARCPEHKTKLIDCCPGCDEQLQWHSSIFDKCNKCGFEWSAYKDNQYGNYELTNIEKALLPNVLGNIANVGPLVDEICAVIVAVARPYDLFIDSFERLPTIKHYSELLLRAIDCFINDAALEDWLSLRQLYLDLLVVESDLPTSLQNNISFESVCAYEFDLPVNRTLSEHAEFVKLKRRKLINDDNTEQLRRHIKAPELAHCLGLVKKDFHFLTEFIKPINGTPILRDRLFDISEASSFLDRLNFSVSYQDKISVKLDSKILRVFLTSYGAVLCALLAGKIKGEVANEANLSEVFVEYSSLIPFLKKELTEHFNSPVGISKAATSLSYGPDKITALVESGKLLYAPWQHVNKISGDSLAACWKERYSDALLREICGLVIKA